MMLDRCLNPDCGLPVPTSGTETVRVYKQAHRDKNELCDYLYPPGGTATAAVTTEGDEHHSDPVKDGLK